MIDIHECISKYHLMIDKVEKISNFIILHGNTNKYLLKMKSGSKKELFDSFDKIHYSYYVPLLSDEIDPYELYPYYDEEETNISAKGEKIVDALSSLHEKSKYEDNDENFITSLYEELKEKIANVQSYYENLQEYIEQFSFPRVDYYFLLTHISLFYQILFKARSFLEEWYQKKPSKIRKAMVLHNACFENFQTHDGGYFINYDNCYQDVVVKDFALLYQKDALKVDMFPLYERYCNQISLTKDEKNLLFCYLCIPHKISFSNRTYANTVEIQKELEMIEKTFRFLSEENEKNQETNKEKFKEQDDNVNLSGNKD